MKIKLLTKKCLTENPQGSFSHGRWWAICQAQCLGYPSAGSINPLRRGFGCYKSPV